MPRSSKQVLKDRRQAQRELSGAGASAFSIKLPAGRGGIKSEVDSQAKKADLLNRNAPVTVRRMKE